MCGGREKEKQREGRDDRKREGRSRSRVLSGKVCTGEEISSEGEKGKRGCVCGGGRNKGR